MFLGGTSQATFAPRTEQKPDAWLAGILKCLSEGQLFCCGPQGGPQCPVPGVSVFVEYGVSKGMGLL